MKKYITLLLLFVFYVSFAQDIHVENGIAYIGDKPYVKIIKKGKKNFFIYDLKSNKQIIQVKLAEKPNERTKEDDHNTKVYFLRLDKNAAFSRIKTKTAKDVVELLLRKNLILSNGSLNEELATEYHETTPIGKRCKDIVKKDFGGILYHKFRPVVGNDTIVINEVKYECVTTAFYTKKVLFDRIGLWHKEIFRNPSSRIPELLWENIQLFEDDDKKFTVIARGLESEKTIYASIMVFDENNYDMLHQNSSYRDKIVTLFADYIRNDKDDRTFYDEFWKRYDPKRWKQMLVNNKPIRTGQKPPSKAPKPHKN